MRVDFIAFISASAFCFAAALLHIAIIFGGPKWYLLFGAGQKMADMAARNMAYPVFVTLGIATILGVWGLYGLAGAGIIGRLPFMRIALFGISAIFLIRGLLPFLIMPFFPNLSLQFWLITSSICAIIGLLFAIGTFKVWSQI